MTQNAEHRAPEHDLPLEQQEAEALDEARKAAEEAVGPQAPTWFSRNYQNQSPEDLAKAYEARRWSGEHAPEAYAEPQFAPIRTPSALEMTAFRRLLEERLQAEQNRRAPQPPVVNVNPQRVQPAPPRRQPLPLSELARHVPPRPAGPAMPQMVPVVAGGRGSGVVALAALGALLIGGGVGFGVSKTDAIAAMWTSAVARVAALAPVPVAPPGPQLATADAGAGGGHKPLESVSLTVKNVEGTVNDPIPLGITTSETDMAAPIALKVMGVPENAYLTVGKELQRGEWLVQSNEIGRASLVVPAAASQQIGLSVAAVEAKTGELAAPMQEMTVALHPPGAQITPAGGPPEQPGDGKLAMGNVPPPSPEAEGLLQKGRMLLESGDLDAARPFLTKAEGMGSGEAALALGQSYDPATFTRLKVQGMLPNVDEARVWYEKAKARGVVEADAALATLDQTGQP